VKFYVGIDLGEAGNHTALAALERVKLDKPILRQRFRYVVRYLEEYPLGVHYPEQIDKIKATLSHPAFKGAVVAPDYTGVGRPVVEMMKKQKVPGYMRPILITGGHKATPDEETGGFHVPKRDLVGSLQILLQADLLGWHEKLSAGPKLKKQLAAFRVRVTKAKNETFGAEGRDQDDIVLAVALACWLGEHTGTSDPAGIGGPGEGEGSAVGSAPAGVFATGNGV
jgi:hypothetical protein